MQKITTKNKHPVEKINKRLKYLSKKSKKNNKLHFFDKKIRKNLILIYFRVTISHVTDRKGDTMAKKQIKKEYFDEFDKALFREYEVRSNGLPSGRYVEFYPSSSGKPKKRIETQITPDLRFVGRYKKYTLAGLLEIDGMLDKAGHFNGNVYQYDEKGNKIGRQLYEKNGNIASFPYNTNGKLDGVFKEQDKDGNIIRTGFYKNGKKSGKWTEYKNGKPVNSYEYKHGQKNGECAIFDENGELIETGFYKNGMPCGNWSVYENGVCTKIGTYDEIKGRDISLECENAQKYYQKTFSQFFEKDNPVYTFKMNENEPELTIHRSLAKKEREQGVRALFKYLSTHEIDLNEEFGAEGFTDQNDLKNEFKNLIKAARENGDNSPEAQKCDRWIGRGLHNIYTHEQNKLRQQTNQAVQQAQEVPQPTSCLGETSVPEIAPTYGRTELHYWADCSEPSLFEKSIEKAQAVLTKHPEYLNTKSTDEHGVTPLMCAINQGNTAMVDLLLAHNADVNCPNNFGETAIMYAARNGNIELIKKMAENGANLLYRAQEGSDYANQNILQILGDNGHITQLEQVLSLYSEKIQPHQAGGQVQKTSIRKIQPIPVIQKQLVQNTNDEKKPSVRSNQALDVLKQSIANHPKGAVFIKKQPEVKKKSILSSLKRYIMEHVYS